MTATESPCRRTDRAASCEECSALVSTSRISPCSTRYDARARSPVSRPRTAVHSKPNAWQ